MSLAADIANAVLDGCDGILLGAETLRGDYPVESVATIAQICRVAEHVFDFSTHYDHLMEAAQEMGEVRHSRHTCIPLGWWMATCAAAAGNVTCTSFSASTCVGVHTNYEASILDQSFETHLGWLCATRWEAAANQVHRGVTVWAGG